MLQSFLRAKNAAGPVAIKQPSDVLLDEKTCRLGGQYRFTTAALSQVCSVLCPGFGQVLYDIAGIRRSAREGLPVRYSPREAVRCFNAMVRFRGDRLVNSELILDRRNRTVEGFVGPDYQFFANLDFWNRVQQFLSTVEGHAFFSGATYQNRRLSLRYRFRDPAFTIQAKGGKREPFYGGWHFSNSEVGDCAVHMSAILLRKWGNSTTLVPLPDVKKLVHRGSRTSFTDKLESMFKTLSGKSGIARSLKGPVEQLVETSLGLGGLPKSHQRQVKVLKAKLVRGKLGPRLADAVIEHVLFCGSYKVDVIRKEHASPASFEELERAVDTEVFEARTVFDLFNALGVRAKHIRPERQELAEQLAYRILTGQFTL